MSNTSADFGLPEAPTERTPEDCDFSTVVHTKCCTLKQGCTCSSETSRQQGHCIDRSRFALAHALTKLKVERAAEAD